MATPSISQVTAVQGNGSGVQPQSPLLEVNVTFSQSSGTADFKVEVSIDGGSNWYTLTAITNAGGNTMTARSPTSAKIWADYSTVPAFNGNCQVRVSARDNAVGGAYGAATTITGIALKTTKPTISYVLMAQYLGAQGNATINHPATITCSSDSVKYRASSNLGSLVPSSTSPGFNNLLNGGYNAQNNAQYTLTTSISDGFQTIYFQVSDQYFNQSLQINAKGSSTDQTILPWWQKTPPADPIARIIGSVGNGEYTGIHIDPESKEMSPDRSVGVQVYAKSPIPLYWRIETTSDVEHSPNTVTDAGLAANVGTLLPLTSNPDSASRRVKLTNTKANPASNDYNYDGTSTINVTFIDAAGNTTVVNPAPKIRLNTRIYQTGVTPLRSPDSRYDTVAFEITPAQVQRPFSRSVHLSSESIRKWEDIIYPATHGYPTNIDGTVNEAAIFVTLPDYNYPNYNNSGNYYQRPITENEWYNCYRDYCNLNGYEPLVMEWANIGGITRWRLKYDTDGRVSTYSWKKDGSRNYNNLESATIDTLRYWVIDNTGYGDFNLEFEWFDLDTGVTNTPRNTLSPYAGDCLVVYDANAEGALEPYVDAAGIQKWRLSNDPGKGLPLCTELMAFTGSETLVYNLKTGQSMNARANGAFETPTIVSKPKLVIVLYSDSQGTGSGFKLKASHAHEKVYFNYDVDETKGEVWIHKHESLTSNGIRGSAEDTPKMLYFDYYDRKVDIDHETGTVTFEVAPTGVVTADYTYHESGSYQSNLFLASWDDLLDYQEAPVYVGQVAQDRFTSDLIASDFEVNGYGRVIQAAQWNKDKGLMEFAQDALTSLQPGQRLFGSYFHHTFKRLQSDGYGDLTFHDSVLVADDTPSFPDYTWADVKIVNEGDARLETGTFKFTFRGYDNNDTGKPTFGDQATMDQVWDTKRPWDIQKGTKDESYDRVAMCVLSVFPWGALCPRKNYTAPNPNPDPAVYNQQNFAAMSIISTWKQASVPLFEPYTTKYGRVVWVLNNGSDNNYPDNTSAGTKRCSLEVSGQYYSSNAY